MQQFTDYPRDHLTPAALTGLIVGSPSLILAGGLELIDQDLNVIEDLSADLAGGSVGRSSYADLHGTLTFRLARRLNWGDACVRPYIELTADSVTARFNLGAYYTSTPRTSTAQFPVTFEVQGYDILLRLAQKIGDAYSVETGSAYLTAVEDILIGRGYTEYIIDQTRADTVLPSAKTWVLDPQITWLTVVNDLLGAIGYQGIWSDWDGRLRVEPYSRPIDRASEWTYDVDPNLTILHTNREMEYDFFEVPNRWVIWKSNDTDGPAPTAGNGLYTYTNDNVGDTSVSARGGLVITRMEQVDAADQNGLVARAQEMIDADMSVPARITANTRINPLHWHFDRIYVNDPDLGPPIDALTVAWSMPLPPDSGPMVHEWSILSQ